MEVYIGDNNKHVIATETKTIHFHLPIKMLIII